MTQETNKSDNIQAAIAAAGSIGAANPTQPETKSPQATQPETPKPTVSLPKPAPEPVQAKIQEKIIDDKAKTEAALAARAKAEAERQPELSRQQRLADACEAEFLRVQELPGATFPYRGYCGKCGWQSMQHTKEEAHAAVRQHVLIHWRDVAQKVAA